MARVRSASIAEASWGTRCERSGGYDVVFMALLAGGHARRRLAYGTFAGFLSHLAHV